MLGIMSAAPSEMKEVFMDVASIQEGGTRRRRRRRRTQKGGDAPAGAQQEPTSYVSVQKDGAVEAKPNTVQPQNTAKPVPASTNVNTNTVPTPNTTVPAQPTNTTATTIATTTQAGGAVVVLAPAKKKTKVMLVPKTTTKNRPVIKKTFKAKRVHVTIDNTPATLKRRRMTIKRLDGLTDDQVRSAAVAAHLSRRDSVAKAPVPLLRQMLKDYQTMKGMLL
jgi:hypothetical protein